MRRGQKRWWWWYEVKRQDRAEASFSRQLLSHDPGYLGPTEVVLGVVPEIPIARAKIFDFSLISVKQSGNLWVSRDSHNYPGNPGWIRRFPEIPRGWADCGS